MTQRLTLVNPPHSCFDRNEVGPPLGLLRIAGAAESAGSDVEIIDFNLAWHEDEQLRADFYTRAVERLICRDADAYGFTSMVVDSHVALELARRVKGLRPHAKIILGGPHFSAVEAEVRAAFPWIDEVRVGAADSASWISEGSEDARRRTDYDRVDFDAYFRVNPHRVADVESARGCRFKCAFCYSPVHHPERHTLSVDRFLRELHHVAARGVRHVFVVDDNFLNDEARAVDLCAAMRESGTKLTWHCYATMPQLNQRIVSAMSDAGCRAIFVGVDAIGPTSEGHLGKRFSSGADRKIEMCLDAGIVPTCAFLVAPPSHLCGRDLERTVSAALAARLLGAEVRLNLLTYYSGTRIAVSDAPTLWPDNARVELGMDVPNVVVENPFAEQYPHLFPFHARYVDQHEWIQMAQRVHVLFTLLHARTHELADMLRGADSSLIGVADQVLKETGDLSGIEKRMRRKLEVEGFDALTRRIAA